MTAQSSVAKLNVEREEKRVSMSLTQLAMRRLRKDPLTLTALAVVLILTLLSAAAPLISNWLDISYTQTDASRTFLPVGAPGHPLGTDDLGRDHLARLLYAGQVSLRVGFLAATVAISIGVTLGIITGFYGGVIDDFINWVIATLNSIPSLFLLLIVAAVLQPSPNTLILVLGFLGWTTTTRLVRGETLSIREREYIVSARAIGASPLRIMFTHILPNLFSIIVISLAIDIGALILSEAALSFLGLGTQPPTASWGAMLNDGRNFVDQNLWYSIAAGSAIFITVLGLNLLGDGLRDVLDPRLRST